MFRHPLGFWFFFWGEFAERCSFYGMRAILAMYMADQLGLGQDNSATYMSFFIAAAYFLPLVGGWVADKWFGKYWTIVGFSLPYILGHVILGIENFTCLVIALLLLAMGSGVIKPNISTLMGLTYDQQRPGETKLRSDGFAIFYFSINIGAAISQFAMPPIRSHLGYAAAFLFPAGLMALAFLIFAAGKKYYAVETIDRRVKTPEEKVEQWRVLGRIFGLFFLVMFFWAIFDQSASTWVFFTEACMNRHIIPSYEMDADQMQAFNPVLILLLLPPITILWRVLSNRGVDVRPTRKMTIGFWLTAGCMGIMALAASLAGQADLRPGLVAGKENQAFRFTVEGGATPFTYSTEKNVGRAKLDATSQSSVVVAYADTDAQGNKTGASVTLTLTGDGVLALAPLEKDADGTIKSVRVEGAAKKLTRVWKKGDERKEEVIEGNLTATLAGDLSVQQRWFVAPQSQVTVWWLVFAYVVITVAEVLISVTGLELAYTAAPKSMTGFVTACWLLTVALANFIINAPVTRLYTKMQPAAYFAMLTGTMVVVSVAFVFVARRFSRGAAPAEEVREAALVAETETV